MRLGQGGRDEKEVWHSVFFSRIILGIFYCINAKFIQMVKKIVNGMTTKSAQAGHVGLFMTLTQMI